MGTITMEAVPPSRKLSEVDVTDERVLNAMRRVKRHLFVPENYGNLAYSSFSTVTKKF